MMKKFKLCSKTNFSIGSQRALTCGSEMPSVILQYLPCLASLFYLFPQYSKVVHHFVHSVSEGISAGIDTNGGQKSKKKKKRKTKGKEKDSLKLSQPVELAVNELLRRNINNATSIET